MMDDNLPCTRCGAIRTALRKLRPGLCHDCELTIATDLLNEMEVSMMASKLMARSGRIKRDWYEAVNIDWFGTRGIVSWRLNEINQSKQRCRAAGERGQMIGPASDESPEALPCVCGNCRWFLPRMVEANEIGDEQESQTQEGQCHRYPPQVEGFFPLVYDVSFCGEFATTESEK